MDEKPWLLLIPFDNTKWWIASKNLYLPDNLSKTTDTQTDILNLLKEHKRIALTCFEANICQCHRKHLAEAIEKLPAFEYEVKHI